MVTLEKENWPFRLQIFYLYFESSYSIEHIFLEQGGSCDLFREANGFSFPSVAKQISSSTTMFKYDILQLEEANIMLKKFLYLIILCS